MSVGLDMIICIYVNPAVLRNVRGKVNRISIYSESETENGVSVHTFDPSYPRVLTYN